MRILEKSFCLLILRLFVVPNSDITGVPKRLEPEVMSFDLLNRYQRRSPEKKSKKNVVLKAHPNVRLIFILMRPSEPTLFLDY